MNWMQMLDRAMARLGRERVVIAGCEARGDLGVPYLTRYKVWQRGDDAQVYLHVFHRSDDDRAMHDHPWDFHTLILWRGYDEVTARGVRRLWPLTLHRRPAEWTHRVRLLQGECRTCGGEGVMRVLLSPRGRWTLRACPTCGASCRTDRPAVTLVFRGRRFREWGFHMPQGWVHWKKFFEANGCDGGQG